MDKREVNNLVREIARGDISAAEKLYGLMKVPLLSFVAPYCADFSEREDVVQAVFLKVIQKSPSLVFFTDCFAWMFRVAKNECFDRAIKRRLLPAEGPREEEDHFDLRFALSKLDAKRRQMVELKYFAGFSQKEIACALHLGESAVSRGLAAALNDLRGWLDEED